MPGILYHLSFAEKVYRKFSTQSPQIPLNKLAFLEGNLIPDLATNKSLSHYRHASSVRGFVIPDMELVKKDLLVPEDSIKFGMFCHLYLDHSFIEDFLIPQFIWDFDTKSVVNPRNNKKWNAETFFSPSGMYGAYTELNQLILRDGLVSLNTIKEIPEILPNTGLPVFDSRREKTWKAELKEYLAQEKEYTGEIFDYNKLRQYLEKISTQFVDEFSFINAK